MTVWDTATVASGANATTLYVTFVTGAVTDFSGIGRGWSATARAVAWPSQVAAASAAIAATAPTGGSPLPTSACPGPLYLAGAGNFTVGAYPNHVLCTWVLTASPPTARVALTLRGVSIQPVGTAGDCLDAVDVWTGRVGCVFLFHASDSVAVRGAGHVLLTTSSDWCCPGVCCGAQSCEVEAVHHAPLYAFFGLSWSLLAYCYPCLRQICGAVWRSVGESNLRLDRQPHRPHVSV